ncbi:uncharacterized protein HMPREF1541_04488 [Cyphellophora europaea CBS 101466]|uniref:Ribosomal RNA-processing protein 43 n=1 Tax=Cyphellophora europaea (strain CBS 101466) TaxID=1220924 RepID=W2RUT8_CYPE1|nr:uncharacterized protein HMPREF1541_04488 [Cyphellophora europaea CBS 101466]ETN40212.1 hypothetical protein HMPREF1541_04488 [Cyphellophora europaea CBS 101466]
MGSLPPTASPSTTATTTTNAAIPPHAMPLISAPALLSAHLSRTPPTRPSSGGRGPTQARPISLNTASLTHSHGSAVVKIGAGAGEGSSSVVCGVRGEILPISEIPSWSVGDAVSRVVVQDAEEDLEDEDEDALWQHNLLVPNISLDTGCSPLHPANTAPSEEQQSLSQRLLSLLLTSRLVRLRDLEIYHHHHDAEEDDDAAAAALDPDGMEIEAHEPAGGSNATRKTVKAFWVLYIDILCISHAGSGSVFDAAWLALCAALRTTVLPAARWDADEGRVLCSSDVGRATRLSLRGLPVPLSWGIFVHDKRVVGTGKGEEAVVLVDLGAMEEEACAERGCVVVDLSEEDGEVQLVRVEKSGGGVAGVREVQSVVKVAEGRWREWRKLLGEACG